MKSKIFKYAYLILGVPLSIGYLFVMYMSLFSAAVGCMVSFGCSDTPIEIIFGLFVGFCIVIAYVGIGKIIHIQIIYTLISILLVPALLFTLMSSNRFTSYLQEQKKLRQEYERHYQYLKTASEGISFEDTRYSIEDYSDSQYRVLIVLPISFKEKITSYYPIFSPNGLIYVPGAIEKYRINETCGIAKSDWCLKELKSGNTVCRSTDEDINIQHGGIKDRNDREIKGDYELITYLYYDKKTCEREDLNKLRSVNYKLRDYDTFIKCAVMDSREGIIPKGCYQSWPQY